MGTSAAKRNSDDPEIAGVRITHPTRVVFPELGLTKIDLVSYYAAVSAWMVPHLRGRPLTLKQCAPDANHCRYLRHTGGHAPPRVRVVQIPEQTKVGDSVVIDDRAALIAMAQRNIVEFHTWRSTVDHLEQPDQLVFDLDPGPEVPWRELVPAAQLVRETLRELGLKSWLKTTGGKGLHVVVPITPGPDWSTCLEFARSLASTLAARHPARYTTKFSKKGRERLILIDYLRNSRTSSAVAPYSVRARATATVSTPMAWDELTARFRPDRWTVRTVPRRLEREKDPWSDFFRVRQSLPV